jgi:tetratricopeptide (TPR) repeat protein
MARRRRRRVVKKAGVKQTPVNRVEEAGYSIRDIGIEKINKIIPPLEKVRRPTDQAAWMRQERLINEYFQEGDLLFDKNDYKHAIEKYEAVIGLAPDYPEANYNLGLCYKKSGEDEKSLKALLKCVRSNQSWEDAWELISDILIKMNKLAEAEEACCKAIITSKEKHWEQYERLGNVLWKKDKEEWATQVFHECLEIDDRSSVAHYHLGLYYFTTDDLESSRDHLNRAVTLAPKYKEAWHALGKTMCLMGYIKNTQQAFQNVLNIDAEHKDARRWLDFTQSVDSCLQEFVEEIHPEYKIPDTSEDAYLQLGLKLLDEKKHEESVDLLSQGHENNPKSPDISLWLGISFAICLRYDVANKLWQDVFDTSQDNPTTRILLCISHIMTCKRVQANWFLKEIEDKVAKHLMNLISMIPLSEDEYPAS